MSLPPRVRWLWVTLVVVFLDRVTKGLIESRTAEGWRYEVAHKFIYLVHAKNPGIAFSLFADARSSWVRIVLIGGSLVIIAAVAWLLVASHSGGARTAIGLALLLGGATGNLTDRILHGGVTDFFEVWFGTYRYPAFNVADAAITIGAILVLIDVLFPPRKPKESP